MGLTESTAATSKGAAAEPGTTGLALPPSAGRALYDAVMGAGDGEIKLSPRLAEQLMDATAEALGAGDQGADLSSTVTPNAAQG